VALALEPSWGRAEPIPVGVDLSEGPERGRTTVGDLDAGDPRIMVYRDFDVRRVHELLLEHLFGRWLTDADFAP
ncbi:MAG: hypothetical protein Q7J79_02680, partial [Gemmatimonadales bacterium]|nr:hypothetical protein [Gemmatimonadales bacterium]